MHAKRLHSNDLAEETNMFKTCYSLGQKYGFIILGFILILSLFIMFAGPIRDGDFFWHYKYGEYMVENSTPVPDHTLYSWTPANGNYIQCSWIGDILLYLMHQAGGLPLLFAFRYLCMFLAIGMVWWYAWKMGYGKDVFTFFLLMIVLLCSYGAAFLKPEIFSLIFMSLTSGLYFSVKSGLWKKWGTRPFLFYPVLFLVWTNTHGVFLFGMVLLGLITLGEIINYRFSKKSALPGKGLKHLIIGALLSVAATFVTPYGVGMHTKYLKALFTRGENPGMKTVFAYRSIFFEAGWHNYDEYWVMMVISLVAILALLVWKKRQWDWGIFIPSLFLAFIFARYNRCMYYWPAFWAMSIIYLTHVLCPYFRDMTKTRILFKCSLILLFILLSGKSVYDARFKPLMAGWLGFGIGYFNPVQASAFLKKYHPGTKLYNSYNTGGYLIYDLYPEYKVFCDPRYFPYINWYAEYWNFNNGPTPLDDFTKKYDFDVALVDYYSSESPIFKFLISRKWEPVFYGTSSMVFVRSDVEFKHNYKQSEKNRFDDLHNMEQARLVLFVAQNLGDLETSEYILELIRKKFSYMPDYDGVVKECFLYQDGLAAFMQGNYEKAHEKLSVMGVREYTPRVNIALFQLRNWKAEQQIQKGKYREALNELEANLRNNPNYVDGLYNAGVLAYQVEMLEKTAQKPYGSPSSTPWRQDLIGAGTNWRSYLERFLKLAPDHRHAWIAKQVLDGRGLPPNVTLAL